VLKYAERVIFGLDRVGQCIRADPGLAKQEKAEVAGNSRDAPFS
jgi:hypothetical protein